MSATMIVLQLIAALEDLGVPYMLVGSFSTNAYGRPRSTKDADLVVEIRSEQLAMLKGRLGPEFRLDAQMTFETITMTSKYVIDHPATAFRIELFLLSSDPHDQSRFARRRRYDFDGHPTWLPMVEDVIVTKLRWARGGRQGKDVADVEDVLAVQRAKLDLDYVRYWCDQHGTRELFEKLLAETPNA
jgi:hypothetical protein